MLTSVAILFHPERQRAVEEAARLDRLLKAEGIDSFAASAFDTRGNGQEVERRDLAIALGGDGTILSVTREMAGTGVPTLGVNLGHVGFLAELTPALLHETLPRIMAQEYWIETRRVLEATWTEGPSRLTHLALNEVALARGTSTRAIRVAVFIDGFEYTTHTADGVMLSTATGSTAYSLAAGGPILYPEATDLLLTPVAPHLHIGRSLVIPGSVVVGLELRGDREAMLAVDGQTECPFEIGKKVEIRSSPKQALFARLGPREYFYSVVSDRLQ